MRTVLIQPPQMWPFGPYLAMPALAAYLRRAGHEVIMIDANLETYDLLFSRSGLLQVYSRTQELFSELDSRSSLTWSEQYDYLRLVEGLYARLPVFADRVDAIKREFRRRDNYRMNPDGSLPLEGWWREFQQVRNLILPDYPNRLGLPALTLARLGRSLDGSEPLLYDHILDNIARRVRSTGAGLIGLSFTFSEQVLPGLTLASHLRRHCPDSHIVAGGSYLSALRDGLDSLLPQLPFLDTVILGEGEQALAALASALDEGRDPHEVPGLVREHRGTVQFNAPADPLPMDELPRPDFSDLELDRYFAGSPVLPYASARGCYWGKCSFCNFALASQRFRVRNPEAVADDLEYLSHRHGRLFYFVQECEPPARMRKLAQALIDRRLDINYWMLARFERDFDHELADKLIRSGCVYIFFGLEAGSDRVNRLMNKGIDLADAHRVIRCCAQAGLHVIVSSIRGFPGETDAEYEETRSFYRDIRTKHSQRIRITGGSHLFRLNRGSDVDHRPEHYRILPGYARAAGELATVYRSFQTADDDANRLALLREQAEAEAPEILYNGILVLIATSLAPQQSAPLITARPRTPAGHKTVEPARITSEREIRLSPAAIAIACRYPVSELRRRLNTWNAVARDLYILHGESLESVVARLTADTPPLQPAPTIVLVGSNSALAVSAKMQPLINELGRGTTINRLVAAAGGNGTGPLTGQIEQFVAGLHHHGLIEYGRPEQELGA